MSVEQTKFEYIQHVNLTKNRSLESRNTPILEKMPSSTTFYIVIGDSRLTELPTNSNEFLIISETCEGLFQYIGQFQSSRWRANSNKFDVFNYSMNSISFILVELKIFKVFTMLYIDSPDSIYVWSFYYVIDSKYVSSILPIIFTIHIICWDNYLFSVTSI